MNRDSARRHVRRSHKEEPAEGTNYATNNEQLEKLKEIAHACFPDDRKRKNPTAGGGEESEHRS